MNFCRETLITPIIQPSHLFLHTSKPLIFSATLLFMSVTWPIIMWPHVVHRSFFTTVIIKVIRHRSCKTQHTGLAKDESSRYSYLRSHITFYVALLVIVSKRLSSLSHKVTYPLWRNKFLLIDKRTNQIQMGRDKKVQWVFKMGKASQILTQRKYGLEN